MRPESVPVYEFLDAVEHGEPLSLQFVTAHDALLRAKEQALIDGDIDEAVDLRSMLIRVENLFLNGTPHPCSA